LYNLDSYFFFSFWDASGRCRWQKEKIREGLSKQFSTILSLHVTGWKNIYCWSNWWMCFIWINLGWSNWITKECDKTKNIRILLCNNNNNNNKSKKWATDCGPHNRVAKMGMRANTSGHFFFTWLKLYFNVRDLIFYVCEGSSQPIANQLKMQ